jgi:hypothetical protein
MYIPARNCAPAVSTATRMISQRGAPSASRRLGLAGLNSWAGKIPESPFRHIHSFSRRSLGGRIANRASVISTTRPRCAVSATVPREYYSWLQTRDFSKADHTQVSGDNQKTEELLEKFEVQEGNQEARPQHTILHEDNKGKQPPIEGDQRPERMTKGSASTNIL